MQNSHIKMFKMKYHLLQQRKITEKMLLLSLKMNLMLIMMLSMHLLRMITKKRKTRNCKRNKLLLNDRKKKNRLKNLIWKLLKSGLILKSTKML